MIRLADILNESVTTLNKIATNVAQKVNCDIKGSCVGFAELFVIEVYKKDPKLLKQFEVVEGYVIEGNKKYQHTWIKTTSGKNIDPTFAQFKTDSNYEKKIKQKYAGQKYFDDTIRIYKLDRNKLDTSRMTVGKWYK